MQEESGEQTDVDGRRMGCNLVHAIDGNTRESSPTNLSDVKFLKQLHHETAQTCCRVLTV
jgi:hypothetical protein